MHIFTVKSQFMVQSLINLSKSIFLSLTPFKYSQDSRKQVAVATFQRYEKLWAPFWAQAGVFLSVPVHQVCARRWLCFQYPLKQKHFSTPISIYYVLYTAPSL